MSMDYPVGFKEKPRDFEQFLMEHEFQLEVHARTRRPVCSVDISPVCGNEVEARGLCHLLRRAGAG
jgi:hypothetical protein